jgi:hypothetical protein
MNHSRVGYVAIVAAGCAAALVMQPTAHAADPPPVASNTTATSKAPPIAAPTLTVYKNASCGCCGKWVEHMQQHGFELTVHEVDNMSPVKERVGLPYGMGSCHTTEVGGYFVEGHVPAAEVARLLKERPKAKGLTVPGMPIGSPGMEQGDKQQPYDVLLVNEDGSTSVYAHYPK